jgi:DNA-binding NarL/FixJ family response regulator
MDSAAGAEPVRLFLVGLSEALARSLARLVSQDSRLVLIGVAPSMAIAGLLLPRARADLLLLDWAALSGEGRDAVQRLRSGQPGLRIACVVNDGEAYVAAALKADADAVISKAGFAAELDALLHGLFPARFGAPGAGA